MNFLHTSEICPRCETKISPSSLKFAQIDSSFGQNPRTSLSAKSNQSSSARPSQGQKERQRFSEILTSLSNSTTANNTDQQNTDVQQNSAENNSIGSPSGNSASGGNADMADIEKRIGEVVQSTVKSQLSQIHQNISSLCDQLKQIKNSQVPDWPRLSNLDPLFPNNRVNPNTTNPSGQNGTNTNQNTERNSSSNSSSFVASSKAANLINSWHISFNGLPSGIPVDKFIRMVNELTKVNFRGDFSILTEHSYLLFKDRAWDWYWRYRLENENLDWPSMCTAMKAYFNDYRTNTDIMDSIRDRKQRSNENFDSFYYAILQLCDRLSSPLRETELVEILRKNLKSELRKELFFLEISSVAQLRKLVLRRENLNAELENNGSKFSNKKVHSVDIVVEPENSSLLASADISEIGHKNRSIVVKCWNCRKDGHKFTDCVESRNIFCYGCGAENVFKPHCKTCNKSEN